MQGERFADILGFSRGSTRVIDPFMDLDYFYANITDRQILKASHDIPQAAWQEGTAVEQIKLLIAGPTFFRPEVPAPYHYVTSWLGVQEIHDSKLFVVLMFQHNKTGSLNPLWDDPVLHAKASKVLAECLTTVRVAFSCAEYETMKLVSPGVGPSASRQDIVAALRWRRELQEAPSSVLDKKLGDFYETTREVTPYSFKGKTRRP